MGNTCVGPKPNANGFIQSLSTAVWRNEKPNESHTSNKVESSRKKSVHAGDDDASSSALGTNSYYTTSSSENG